MTVDPEHAATEPPPTSPTATASILGQRVVTQLAVLARQPLAPGLHIVATPIGHLGDITLRALTTLAAADLIYCEDTRRSRPLLAHFGIAGEVRAYHEHNGERERPIALERLAGGARIALISDAGTPLVSDPGYKLVRAVLAAGFAVTAVPGASSLLAALTVSGLPTDLFTFAGFLPPRRVARRARIAELAGHPGTLILFETALRLDEVLQDLQDGLGDREATVARELTKLNETVYRGPLSALRSAAIMRLGEIVLVIGPAPDRSVDDAAILARLEAALARTSLRDAARSIAAELGVTRTRVYDLGVRMKSNDTETGG
jgi:16S rRNA (cytidine1402-2'-O)-methyltransferase